MTEAAAEAELQVGPYLVKAKKISKGYQFTLYKKVGERLSGRQSIIVSEKKGKEGKLVALGSSYKMKNERVATSFELDLLRFFIEDFLYKKGFRVLRGLVRSKLSKAMRKRGWVVGEFSAVIFGKWFIDKGYSVRKILSKTNNPEPLIARRLKKRKIKKRKTVRRKRF